ncbi:phosphatidylinositol phosphate synthase [Actinocorallia libanotica]|uniref:Phosphatidylinositol phosphate synthase n=1 Tax=Actinocorallia libanotica TaxID=46162 RepID=A0ABN1R253_9ACTN
MLNRLRPALAKVVTPIGRTLARTGVTPNMITVTGTLGVAAGALALYPRGELFWGTMAITAFVFFDMFDGAVARITGRTGAWGAFLDSTMDRVGDAAVFTGLILWFTGGGDNALLTWLALYCMVSGVVISYAKARAEGLGLTCDVGIAERSERLIISLVAAGLHGLGVPYALHIGLGLLAVLSTVTVAQRFHVVHRQAAAEGVAS